MSRHEGTPVAPARTDDAPSRSAHVRRVLPIPATRAWSLLTDVRNHARWVPLTSIDAPPAMVVGDSFTAVSLPQLGRLGLVDTMVLERFDAPHDAPGQAGSPHAPAGVARYVKTGPVLRGWAEVRVRPLGPTHCEVTWVERITLRGVPGLLTDAVSRPLTRAMLHHVLAAVAREIGEPRNDQPSQA
ncbi:MAG: hypothetical protein HGA44_16035 [Cellulomonadaceae bacterium]|nr:hypothetical protein [Cellulomonadaceae bacterium]